MTIRRTGAANVHVRADDLRELVRQLGPAAEAAYMTAAQILTAESYARGRSEGKAELLIKLLGLRFGVLPEGIREQILQATADLLDLWAERLITAQTLDEVLG